MKVFYLLVFLVLAFGYLCAQDTIIQLKPVEISTSKSEIVRLAPHYELINLEEIQLQTMSKEMPAILSQLPGIHYVPGRGIGDTELRIRGFDVSNIQLLINDIPESYVDEGWTYWSNFTGIEDFTQSVFVTKGVSNTHPFSKAGGTISIHLLEASAARFTRFSSSYSQLSGNKINFTHSSGLLKNGFAWAVGGTYRFGSSYKDETWFRGGNYFFNASKKLNTKHTLQLTVFGAPQQHGQASNYLPDSVLQDKELSYNPSWGYLNGDPKQSNINFYHRTLVQLKHLAEFSKKNQLKSILNFSNGSGGATVNFGNWLPGIEQIDFDAAYSANQNNYDSTFGGNNALYFLGDYVHKEASFSLYSELNHHFSDSARIDAGILAYSSLFIKDNGRINDLLGADYQVYPGEETVRYKGDDIWYKNKASRHGAGVFATWVKSADNTDFTLSGSFIRSTGSYTELFNVPDSAIERTDMKWFNSYNLKGSVQHYLTKNLAVYTTAGFQHRRPPVLFIGKTVIDNVIPENFTTVEAGMRRYFESPFQGQIHGSVYYTARRNQNFVNYYTDGLSGEMFTFSVEGLNSRYMGAEIEFEARWSEKFMGSVAVSYNNVMWLNNIQSTVTDLSGAPIDTIVLNAKGIFDGNQPQLAANISGLYTIRSHYQIFAEALYNGLNYSWFNVLNYTGSNEVKQSWQIPDYVLVDLGIAYKTKLRNKVDMRLSATIHNVLDNHFIAEGIDGANHDKNSSYVLYGHGRCLTAGVVLEF